MSVREQKRELVYEQIKTVAYDLMQEHGTAGITIRGITRAMGLSATALYRYYENLDALITDLIVDAFNGLANAIDVEVQRRDGQSVANRLYGAFWAYRHWAITYPVRFELIYGNPIPNYSAPPDITVPASNRTQIIMGQLIGEGLLRGEIIPNKHLRDVPETLAQQYALILEQTGFAFGQEGSPPRREQGIIMMDILVTGWVQLHGIVMLEILRHITPIIADMDVFFERFMHMMFDEIGFQESFKP